MSTGTATVRASKAKEDAGRKLLRHTGPHHSRRGHPHSLFLHWAEYSGSDGDTAPQEPGKRRSPGYLPVFE